MARFGARSTPWVMVRLRILSFGINECGSLLKRFFLESRHIRTFSSPGVHAWGRRRDLFTSPFLGVCRENPISPCLRVEIAKENMHHGVALLVCDAQIAKLNMPKIRAFMACF